MNRNLSVFIDLLRLFAALLVLIGHAGEVYRMDLPAMVGHSAKEGVAIFFVLSGFVIAFVTQHKERDWRSFARARALRMYSVVPLAVAVMIACHVVGTALNPGAYGLGEGVANRGAVGDPPAVWPVLRYLTFTNEIWFDRAMVSTGAPFWSLGFEVAYYIGFAIPLYARGGWRWGLLALWLLVCGPRIVLAAPLWLIGVGAWAIVSRGITLRPAAGGLLLAAVALATLAWRRWCGEVAAPLFEWPDPITLTASMGYYLVLSLLLGAAIVVFAACTSQRAVWPGAIEAAVRYCAGASFTLYIAHLPVMVLLAAVWPASVGSLAGGMAATGITVAVTFALAEIGERRKSAYTRLFTSIRMNRVRENNKAISAID